MKRTLFLWLLLPLLAGAQTPSCQFKGTFTATGVSPANPGFDNSTASPTCNAWALTWNTAGFSAISIQLQGSDDGSSWTAYSGSTTVLVGSNPSTALSGAIVVQGSSKLAHLQVKLNSATGSGTVSFQVYGYNGVTNAAKSGSGGGSTSWANITPGTNNKGFFQCQAPCVLEPTPISPGGIYATQMVDGNDLPAVTITTPGGPAIDYLNVATSTGGGGATVTISPVGADGNVILALVSKGTANLLLNGCSITSTGALACPGTITSGSGSGAAGGFDLTQGTALSTVANTITLMAPTAVTAYLVQLPGTGSTGFFRCSFSGSTCTTTWDTTPVVNNAANTGTSAFTLDASASTVANAVKVPVQAGLTTTANGAIGYDSTGNNLHAGQGGADAKLAQFTVTPTNGNCVEWLVSSGKYDLGDAGSPCGSGSGGGVVTYSATALALTGTQFIPPGGGGSVSTTEANVQTKSPSAATVSNLQAVVSVAPGVGNSFAITWRDAGSDTALTCTISGASTSCADTTHSFSAAAGDLLAIKIITTGVTGATNLNIMTAFGTSGVGVTSVFGNSGPVVGATGDINATGRVVGINSVPLCTGFTPTNGQNLQYTTASLPNPCYTAATSSGAVSSVGGLTGAVPGGWVLLESHTASSSSTLDFTSCISGSYDDYAITGVGIQASSNGASLLMRVGTGAGPSWDSGSNYDWTRNYCSIGAGGCGSAGSVGSANDSSMTVAVLVSSTASTQISQIRFGAPAATSSYHMFQIQTIQDASDTGLYSNYGGAGYLPTTAITGIRFLMSSGTIAAGTIRCYGIAKQ